MVDSPLHGGHTLVILAHVQAEHEHVRRAETPQLLGHRLQFGLEDGEDL